VPDSDGEDGLYLHDEEEEMEKGISNMEEYEMDLDIEDTYDEDGNLIRQEAYCR